MFACERASWVALCGAIVTLPSSARFTEFLSTYPNRCSLSADEKKASNMALAKAALR